MHRGLTVSVPLLRMWVHCPRASNGLLPRRSNLVGYVRWDARSDRFPPCQTIIPTAFRWQSGLPVNQDLPVDHSTLRDPAGRFAPSNYKLLSFLPCPRHKLGIRRLMRETRD